MLDRTKAPAMQQVENIHFLNPELFTLDNGVIVYALKGGEQEIIKTDFVLDAGSLLGNNRLVASTASDLLFTGANGKSSEEIANEFDFYGAFNSKSCHFTDNLITNFCLTKHSDSVYGLLSDYINNASFTSNELEVYKFVKIQNLTVSKQKTSYIARKAFTQALFEGHPYGYFTEVEDYKNLTINEIENFYNANKKLKYIILSGAYTAETIAQLNKYFGKYEVRGSWVYNDSFSSSPEKIIHIPKADAMQCTVRLGFKTINRLHPDYPKLGILVTLLGGFFGSRLMKNIREDKGYTYGIHASVISYPDCGVFGIQTDVRKEVYNDTVSEIFKEINRLKNEPISDEEIDILSNYSLGSFLRSIDGAFAVSEKYKTLLDFGQDYNYYHNYIRLLKNIDRDELMQIARTYFVDEDIYQVVAGV
ncbi:MAG: insulinase family protein [Bacteroidetes bacterium]|nr:MAG: insulinase family protein [Bacteroidota bacterium]